MTDRARVASLPDEIPVEDLPLPRVTINRLRVAGVLSLGELRAMRDRELLALRHFGRGALADVRALVPAPEQGPPAPERGTAMSAGSEVMIAGRVFTLGTVYVRRAGLGRTGHRPRRLLGYDPDSPLPGGRVTVVTVPHCRVPVFTFVCTMQSVMALPLTSAAVSTPEPPTRSLATLDRLA